jgi:hypothetical protein
MLLELNIKTKNDLDKYIGMLESGQYSSVTITSKKGNLDLDTVLSRLNYVPLLRGGSKADGVGAIDYEPQYIQQFQIIPTFSCSSNYNQNALQTFERLNDFIKILHKHKIKEFLLVSGNPKMKLDVLEALKLLKDKLESEELYCNIQDNGLQTKINIGIAYNPYSKNLELENARLKDKLESTNVTSVWLQLGQDLEKLKTGVDFIRTIKPNSSIVNSILLPSKTLLKSLQFRPWSGVFYTDEFYNSLDFALQNVKDMKQLSLELELEILISGL